MSSLTKQGKKNPVIRQKAVELTRFLRQKDWLGEIHALFDFVQNNIRYLRDINGVETVHTPEQVLAQGQGDCDDKSILLASLLESIGHPTRFCAIGFSPGKISHVFVQTRVGGPNKWISLETTEPVDMGWHPKKPIKDSIVWYN